MDRNTRLAEAFADIDVRLRGLEAVLRDPQATPDFDDLLHKASGIAKDLMVAYAHHEGKTVPVTDDLLEVFRAFVKGDPSLNAIRDNVRELVYYRNCLEMGETGSLPVRPAHMAVRTARHLYLYLSTRCTREQRFP